MTGREIVDYAFDIGGWVVIPNTPNPVSFDELFRQSTARIIDDELAKQKAEALKEFVDRWGMPETDIKAEALRLAAGRAEAEIEEQGMEEVVSVARLRWVILADKQEGQ